LQLRFLERRTARGGKDSIDHGPGQHDDLANSVAGALCLAAHCKKPLNFHPPTLGPPRFEWIASHGFFDPAGASSCDKPGGWEVGDPRAGGFDAQLLGWSVNQRH
jgi:hypothetical protein